MQFENIDVSRLIYLTTKTTDISEFKLLGTNKLKADLLNIEGDTVSMKDSSIENVEVHVDASVDLFLIKP